MAGEYSKYSTLQVMILVLISGKTVCIHDPLTYKVSMYHHQNLVLFGDQLKEGSTFHLKILDEQQMINRFKHRMAAKPKTRKRSKRQNENHDVKPQKEDILQYDGSSHQYHGGFESSKSESNKSYDYDYEKLKQEYYHDISTEKLRTTEEDYEEYEDEETTMETTTKFEPTLAKEDDVPMENYCSVQLLFRIRVFQCFAFGIRNGNDDIKSRAGYVILFWFTLYGIIAAYLWCTRGWCCCCCLCLCCRPRDIFEDAKQFLSQNPPGKIQLRKHKSDVSYTPTEYEQACYKELEMEVLHF